MGNEFFKGVTFGFYARNGYFSSQAARDEADKIAALGIEWVCLVSTVMQETFASTRTFRDSAITPGDDELCDIITYLRDRGVKVMLRPMIECWDGTQRCHLTLPAGNIIPGKPIRYRELWFENYCGLTRHYTRVATRCGCEAYGLDSELNHLAGFSDEWMTVVECARKNFKGHLTSSFIDAPQFTWMLEQNPNHWFYALDSVGSSMYAPAAEKSGVPMDGMVKFLEPVVARNRTFAKAYGKNFHFGECGCCAAAGAAKLPYFWDNGGGYDGGEQARYMEAVIRAFSKEDWWRGLFWWKWDEQNSRPQFTDDPAGDKGFTISGKPAEKVMGAWCKTGL